MAFDVPTTMRAVALESFGGPERLAIRELPVPELDEDEVLLALDCAGIGEWDAFEREGGYARLLGLEPRFPYVLGSEGAGTIVRAGAVVRGRALGERVLAIGFLNPKGGFYAEYVAVKAELVAPIPSGMDAERAAALGGVGITALRGLEDVLRLEPDESVMVFGASGGVGHLAVQLAKRRGARVLAIASGPDGCELAARLGADAVVDGHAADAIDGVHAFDVGGIDAALLTAGGEAAAEALSAIRKGGRVAYPNGIEPIPRAPTGVELTAYNGEPDAEILQRLLQRLQNGTFEVHIARRFAFAEAGAAHHALERHHLGKLVLRIDENAGAQL